MSEIFTLIAANPSLSAFLVVVGCIIGILLLKLFTKATGINTDAEDKLLDGVKDKVVDKLESELQPKTVGNSTNSRFLSSDLKISMPPVKTPRKSETQKEETTEEEKEEEANFIPYPPNNDTISINETNDQQATRFIANVPKNERSQLSEGTEIKSKNKGGRPKKIEILNKPDNSITC